MLENEEWKYDIIPEIMDGKNIADFIDPEIQSKLAALEEEEAELIAKGYYDIEDVDLEVCAHVIACQHFQDPNARRPRTSQVVNETERLRSESRVGRKRVRSVSRGESLAAGTHASVVKRAKTIAPGDARSSSKRDRSVLGLGSGQKAVADAIKKKTERARNLLAKAGESDRAIQTSMPKHLFSGKRGFSANHR